MGNYLCPRCLIVQSEVPRLGMESDWKKRQDLRDYTMDAGRVELAREHIFDSGMSVGGELTILKDGSLIPTRVMYTLPITFAIWLTYPRTHTTLN